MANNASQDTSPTIENVMVSNIKNIDNDLTCAGGLDVTSYPAPQDVLNQRSKTPSFQITSVYVGSNSRTSNEGGNDSADELDESDASDLSVDTSRITDIENESSYCTEDTYSKEDVHINLDGCTIASVPVTRTSAQYGLAVVGSKGENCTNDSSLIKDTGVTVTENGSIMDGARSEEEMRDCPPQHPSRNERFRVVKIVSTEPFKCGRWECMDYLDQNMLQLKKSQLEVINNVKQFGSDSSSGTVNYIPADSSVGIPDSSLPCNLDQPIDTVYFTQDNQFAAQQNPPNLISVQAQCGLSNSLSPGLSVNQERVQFPVVPTTQNANVHTQENQNPNGNPHYQPQWFNQPQQINTQSQQQSNRQPQVVSQSPFHPQLQHNLQSHGDIETQPNVQHHPSIQATLQDPHVICPPQFHYSQTQEATQQVQGTSQSSLANHLLPEALQTFPSQQLQHILKTILHQIGGQQDETRQHDIVQQVSQHLLQNYNWQNTTPTVEPLSSPQSSQIGSPAALMHMQTSGPGLSQNLQMAQLQQQQQGVGLNQEAYQPIATNLTQHQQVPALGQYTDTVQQQYPAQLQNQFQQVPLIQLFPRCQQQSPQIPTQAQPNYQQMPNVQPSGQQGTRMVPVGDSQSAPNLSQQNDASQSGLIHVPGNRRSPSLSHSFLAHPSTASSRSELFFTPTVSWTERQAAGSHSTSAVQGDKGLQSPGWFGGNGSCRFEMTSERPSLERLNSALDIEAGIPEAGASGASVVAIDNKIEQAMDLVKSHLMFAVREEVEILKERIADLTERIAHLEVENTFLRSHATPDVLALVNNLLHQPAQPPQYPPKDST